MRHSYFKKLFWIGTPLMLIGGWYLSAPAPVLMETFSHHPNHAKDIRLYGMDHKKQQYFIFAESGLEQELGLILLIAPELTLNLESGHVATIRADQGIYNPAVQTVTLHKGVKLTYSLGYELTTTCATVDLKKSIAYGAELVHGQSPQGKLCGSKGFQVSREGIIALLGRSEVTLSHDS